MSIVGTWTEVITEELQFGLELIGQWIYDRRRETRMSQARLGELAAVDQSTISRLENGKLRSLRLIRLAAIVAALNGMPRGEPLEVRLTGEPWETTPWDATFTSGHRVVGRQ